MSGSPREDFDPFADYGAIPAGNVSDELEEIAEGDHVLATDIPGDGPDLRSDDYDSFEVYLYATTPPNRRAQVRFKDKKRHLQAKIVSAKSSLERQDFDNRSSGRKTSLPLRLLEFGGGGESSDTESIAESTSASMAEANSRRKRETRTRTSERNTKADLNPFGEQELASSGESMTVDTASRFRCLNQTLATKRAADSAQLAASKSLKVPPLHTSPSVASLNVPKDRYEFHRTFTMLISLGNVARKEKDIPERYIRQLSSEQEMWRSSLSDVIWLELQARLHQRSVEEHDTALCSARQSVTATLQRVLDFHAATTSADECGCDSSKSRWCRMSRSRYGVCLRGAIVVQEAVLEQVTATLQELEAAEALYPTQKALASQHAIYTTDDFQRQVGTLCLWLNITIDVTRMLILVAKIISVGSIENTPWSCLDLDRLQHMLTIVKKLSPSGGEITTIDNFADSNDSTEDEEEEYTDEEEDEEEEDEVMAENTTSDDLAASSSLSASTGKKRVCFDDRPTEIGQPESSRVLNGVTDGHARLAATVHGSNGENPTLVYRHYVDRTLKKTGLKKLRLRLKELVNGTLQRTRLALLKPKELSLAETNTALTHVQFTAEEVELLSTHGVWSRQFESMGLPSFKPTYLFLVHVLLDLIHECLKLRLEQRPRSEPSLLSQRPLICECKEILNAAVIMKQYYLHMVSPVAAGIDFESNMDAYEDTLQQMLEVYFNYIQAWMNGLQQLPEMSKRLKNFLEEEWNFTKRVCPHVRGGEANAGKRFCVMASSLLRSISDFLETGIDDCVNQLYDIQSAELSPELEKSPSFNAYSPEILTRRNHKLRQDITKTCRKFKENFHEARERSSKALGFAKMLRKDLEVAAEFHVNVPLSDLFATLKTTNHIRVRPWHEQAKAPHGTNYQMFIPEAILNSHKRILQLLNVTCGREDISVTSDPQVEGYLLLVNCEGAVGGDAGGPQWDGGEVEMELTAETTIALVHIEVDGLLFVVIHSAQLMDQRREFQLLLGNCITLNNDQKSCHKHIADSMMELKNSALDLRKRVAKAIKQVDDKLNPMELSDMAEAEKDVMQKLFCETLHQCYNFGFEYHKEVTRLVSGEMRLRLSKALVKFAKQWMKFVMEKCERGRGRRPRWACHGLDFLSVACELRVLVTLTDEQFEELKKSINDCITHIIGDKVPISIQTPAFRVSSPDVTKQMKMMRHTSMPDTTRNTPKPVASRFSLSEPTTPFTNSSLNTKKSVSSTGIPTIADHEDDGGITFEVHDDSKGPNLDRLVPPIIQRQVSDKTSHFETMMQEIRRIEVHRQAYLRKQNLIGRPTNQRLEDYRINIRGVTFRWQRGIKIGEGQFGKVYTAVNIDTGVLMAMKEMPLQPNDHQAIRTLVDEIKIFEGILHPSVVHYYGVELHRDEMIIFMEYCQNGTIADLARQESMDGERMGLSEGMIRKYTNEILTAIHILHENAIVHRDIKGANVFLTPDGHVKLGDFGCSAKLKNHTTMPGELKPGVGTPAYMAPEVIANSQDGCGRAADIWGLACVIIEMATGKRPWPEMESKFQIMFHVGMGNSPPVPAFLSEEGKDFLSHCFQVDPQLRWTASQLKDHQFVMVDEEEP